ncbi:MAG: Short-chain dehydrogenase [Subtercola sp.]|nr:Short-chain dehydrogenase [Subtercola sp.]
MTGLLNGNVAVITGGASGIGLASVQRFVAEGARVAIGDISDEQGARIAEELGDAAIFVHTDVTDEAAIANIITVAVEKFGRLDIMFNNAGNQGDTSAMAELNADGFDRTLALLTRSVALGHKYASQQFQKQGGGGVIISTSSVAGLQGAWAGAAYTAAKHAVIGLVRQAAAEFAPLGIRSNAIAPGTIMTPIMANAFGVPREDATEFLAYLSQELGPKIPLGRVGEPEDIADVAVFLASDLARYVTGTVIPIDGGASAITQGTFGPDVVRASAEFLDGARV